MNPVDKQEDRGGSNPVEQDCHDLTTPLEGGKDSPQTQVDILSRNGEPVHTFSENEGTTAKLNSGENISINTHKHMCASEERRKRRCIFLLCCHEL